jgi:hypothetical protein
MSRFGATAAQDHERFAGRSEVSAASMMDALVVLPLIATAARYGGFGLDLQGTTQVSGSAVTLRGMRHEPFASARSSVLRRNVPPNRAFNRTRNGMAPGPRSRLCSSSAARPGRHAAACRLTLR